MRTAKTVNGVTHTYIYAGGKLMRETYGTNTLDFFYDASGMPYAIKYNGTLYYYITNLQGDILHIVDGNGQTVVSYEYDPYGKLLSTEGTMVETLGIANPLRYRGYYYDAELEMYYLQSRYYDPEVGRFINGDILLSTGQGIIGHNMFAYCGNNPVLHYDPNGQRHEISAGGVGEYKPDYVIYYSHPESDQNLDEPARQNHPRSGCLYISVSSFEELTNAVNSTPSNTDDVFIYLHSDESNLSFYYAQYYSAEDIRGCFEKITIDGCIYLFSCKGGRGDIATTIACQTGCTVVASVYKVSFDEGAARCGWENYFWDLPYYGPFAWYYFYPNGGKEAARLHYMLTQ